MRNTWIWILLVVAVIAGGFLLTGTPGTSPSPEKQAAPHAIDQTP